MRVSCEGYDYSDDPYILAGSCGVFYFFILKMCLNVYFIKNSSQAWILAGS